jgi:hypothetical protein
MQGTHETAGESNKAEARKEPPARGKAGEPEHHHPPGEECRCKEAAEKSLPEILKTMVRDLAFWKKDR